MKDISVLDCLGKRVLAENRWGDQLTELVVLEISPSQTRVKFRYPSGAEIWENIVEFEEKQRIVEALPSKLLPANKKK